MVARHIEETGVSVDDQRSILQQEQRLWANTRYKLRAQIMIRKDVGWTDDEIDPLVKELEQVNHALETIDGMIAAL